MIIINNNNRYINNNNDKLFRGMGLRASLTPEDNNPNHPKYLMYFL